MAIGEAACVSVHGANRLGSNSLLDLVVFGRAAAQRAAEIIEPGAPPPPLPRSAADPALERLERLRNASGRRKPAALRLALQRLMQSDCSIYRTGRELDAGVAKIAEVAASMAELGMDDRSLIWNSDLVEALELDNLIGQASVTLHSALNRTESRGGHAREDFPERDDALWLKHTVAWRDASGAVRLAYRPVHLQPLSNEVASVPPQKRVY